MKAYEELLPLGLFSGVTTNPTSLGGMDVGSFFFFFFFFFKVYIYIFFFFLKFFFVFLNVFFKGSI